MSNFLPSEPKIALNAFNTRQGKKRHIYIYRHTHPYSCFRQKKASRRSPQILWESKILPQIKTFLSFLKNLKGFLLNYFRINTFYIWLVIKIKLTEHNWKTTVLSLQPVAYIACSWLLVLEDLSDSRTVAEGWQGGTGTLLPYLPPFPKATQPPTATDHHRQRPLGEGLRGMLAETVTQP